MKPYYQDKHDTLYCMDFRKNDLSDESIQCVVTSPPYWGLRKYSGEQELIWGDNHCEHQWDEVEPPRKHTPGDKPGPNSVIASRRTINENRPGQVSNICSLCGAWKGAYGLEPTPEMYIEHTILILREIRRVLRKDGVVFWNIGDSYAANRSYQVTDNKWVDVGNVKGSKVPEGLKPKDLCLIPFKVAIAAQEDGWWVRSVIIWSKPNPMPESVTDRPTESHEYILMLTKSKNYYWDADAVREQTNEYTAKFRHGSFYVKQGFAPNDAHRGETGQAQTLSGRNIRSVWEFPTQSFPAAHFAVFPEKLPEICIKAATPEVGCCSKCGAPWERITDKTVVGRQRDNGIGTDVHGEAGPCGGIETKTLGWQPTCKCNADKVPSIVLDPFAGAGTTGWVAKKLNRRCIMYELSKEYCDLTVERNRQQIMI